MERSRNKLPCNTGALQGMSTDLYFPSVHAGTSRLLPLPSDFQPLKLEAHWKAQHPQLTLHLRIPEAERSREPARSPALVLMSSTSACKYFIPPPAMRILWQYVSPPQSLWWLVGWETHKETKPQNILESTLLQTSNLTAGTSILWVSSHLLYFKSQIGNIYS